MKLLPMGVAMVAALGLSACSTTGLGFGGGNSNQLADAIMKIATDPTCGHTDELHAALGPVPQGTLDLKRECPAAGAPAKAPTVAPVK